MTNILEQILQKKQEYADFLNSVDREEFRQFSRKELKEFDTAMYNIKTPMLRIPAMIQEKKEQEYPELLGVHRFPILKEIDFLSEETKVNLDSVLAKFREGNFITTTALYRVIGYAQTALVEKTLAFLLDKGYIAKNYHVLCPCCVDYPITRLMDQSQKDNLDAIIDKKKITDEEELLLERTLGYMCEDCHGDFDPLAMKKKKNITYRTLYKVMMNRDTSLDHV
ncbi:hypothetical protein ACQKJG_18310 [Priestia megaterium]|uniref:hypothetical protein n=1 Tax=Priestia megaterium TaxID=1404 RepID=UPI003D009EB3